MKQTPDWEAPDFSSTQHYVDLGNEKVSVQLRVGVHKPIQLTLREPGVVAFVSRPEEEGLRVLTLTPSLKRVSDSVEIDQEVPEHVREWLLSALFGDKE